jgi:hypothetical protein
VSVERGAIEQRAARALAIEELSRHASGQDRRRLREAAHRIEAVTKPRRAGAKEQAWLFRRLTRSSEAPKQAPVAQNIYPR